MAEEKTAAPSKGKERLSGVLFNHTRYEILWFLLNNPDEQYSIADIQNAVDVSRPIISDFVNELRDIGLVEKKRKGNLYLISVNQDSPYLYALQDLLELDAKPLKESAEEVADELITYTGVTSIYLFGSVARGTPRIDSDIDILIVYNDNEFDEDVKRKIDSQVHKKGDEWNLTFSLTYYSEKTFQEDKEAGIALLERIEEEGEHLAGEKLW